MEIEKESAKYSRAVKTIPPKMTLLTPDLTSTIDGVKISLFQEKQLKRLIALLKRRKSLWEDIPLNKNSNSFFQEKCIILGHDVGHTNECTRITRVNIRAYAPKLDSFLSFHYDVTDLRDGQKISLRNASSYTCRNIAKFHAKHIVTLFGSSDDIEDFIDKVTCSIKPCDVTQPLF